MTLARIEDGVRELRSGRPLIVVDDEDRENEGDVVLAAELATPQWTGWTVRHTSGVLCAPMTDSVADRLLLPPMVRDNQDPRRTAYTVSVDAADGITTGISAADRSRTLRLLADPGTRPDQLVRPGHVFPLRARAGGVLDRAGHTEASVDLCLLAGLEPVALIAELVHDDGSMMRLPDLLRLGTEHGLLTVAIADLVAWRRGHHGAAAALPATDVVAGTSNPRVRRRASTRIPTRYGVFTAVGYRDLVTGAEHVALVQDRTGAVPGVEPRTFDAVDAGDGADDAGTGGSARPARDRPEVLVRVHSECLTGDTFGSLRCDCGPQLDAALARIADQGGVLVYLGGHEGRGVGLLAKLDAYALQDDGKDTVDANLELGLPADAREYGAAAAILDDLGVRAVRLLTNNPAKAQGLTEHGIRVAARLPLRVPAGQYNARYLATKRDRMGHDLNPVPVQRHLL